MARKTATERRVAPKANDRQVGGKHYQKYGDVQPWDTFTPWGLNPFQAEVVKLTVRYRDKGGIQDLEKAVHWLQKLIEIETAKKLAS